MPSGYSASDDFSMPKKMIANNMLTSLGMITWVAGFPASEMLLQTWDPLVLICARLIVTVVPLLFLWRVIEGMAKLRSANWACGILVGGVGFGIGSYLLLWGQWASDPVTVAIIASVAPIAGLCLSSRPLPQHRSTTC